MNYIKICKMMKLFVLIAMEQVWKLQKIFMDYRPNNCFAVGLTKSFPTPKRVLAGHFCFGRVVAQNLPDISV